LNSEDSGSVESLTPTLNKSISINKKKKQNMGLLDTNSGEMTSDVGKDREWIDPLFSIKSLRDKNLVEYYCDKLAAQQN